MEEKEKLYFFMRIESVLDPNQDIQSNKFLLNLLDIMRLRSVEQTIATTKISAQAFSQLHSGSKRQELL